MRKIYYILLCTIVLVACKKGKADFTIAGILTDSTFGQPFSGATVSLYEVPAGGGTNSLVGQMTTNANGAYSFTFPRDQAESYVLTSDKNNYFPLEETIYFSDLTIEEDNIRNFSTTAKAWVRLRFVNQAPADPTDLLRYLKQSGKVGCSECHTTEEQFLSGIVDTVIRCATDGNTTFSYFYDVIGASDQGIKSANAVAFDTTEILLNY
jgi:hypothetical protein